MTAPVYPTQQLDARDTAPYAAAAAITVATPFPYCRAIYVGGAGNLTLTMGDGSSVQFSGVLAGTILPIRGTNVPAATATNLVALY